MVKGYTLIEIFQYNYFSFVENRVEKIKHQYSVFQKSIGHYYIKMVKEGINDMETKPDVVE